MKRLIIITCALLISGCATADSTTDSETMYIKAAALTKLSASVESTVRYKNPPEGISDEELLMLSTQHDPALLTPFFNYTLKVFKEHLHAVVLMCDHDQKHGLLEDAGCTAKLDSHLWQVEGKDCAFTLSILEVCSVQ